MIKRLIFVLVLFGALASGCSSEPVDVSGDYSVSITNGDNGCNFADWTVGDTATNVPVTITQDGAQVTAQVTGIIGGLLQLWLGANAFTGEVDGSSLDLTLYGTTSATQGNCTYTINSRLVADVDGDLMSGQIRYEAATNGNPDCVSLEGCATIQNFNGTRPPQP